MPKSSIVSIVAITIITVRTSKKKRSADYQRGDRTYDDVLNMFMDRVSLEDISREQVQEHVRRLESFQGFPRVKFRARASARRTSGS